MVAMVWTGGGGENWRHDADDDRRTDDSTVTTGRHHLPVRHNWHGRPNPGRFGAGNLRGRKSTVQMPYGAGSGESARADEQSAKADNVVLTDGVAPAFPPYVRYRLQIHSGSIRRNFRIRSGWRRAARRLEHGSVVTRRTATMVETDVASGGGGAVGPTAAVTSGGTAAATTTRKLKRASPGGTTAERDNRTSQLPVQHACRRGRTEI